MSRKGERERGREGEKERGRVRERERGREGTPCTIFIKPRELHV